MSNQDTLSQAIAILEEFRERANGINRGLYEQNIQLLQRAAGQDKSFGKPDAIAMRIARVLTGEKP